MLSVVMILSTALPAFAADQNKPVFPDISGHWAEKVITALYNDKVVAGYPDGKFHPNDNITRSEFSSMLAKWLKLDPVEVETPSFVDIGNHWATQQIEQLLANRVLVKSEYGSRYGVGMPITRIEMMRLMVRALNLKMEVENSMIATKYLDDASLSFRDRGIVNACTKYGIVNGYPDKTVGAYRIATRAEGAQMLKKMMIIYETSYKMKLIVEGETVKEFGLAQDDRYHLPSIPEKEDYNILGWNTKEDGTGNMYEVGSLIRVAEDTTLYAIYDPIYKVVPSVKLAIPNTSKPGEDVELEVTKSDVKTMDIVLKKDGKIVDIKDYVVGEVKDETCSFSFNTRGHYEFIYTATNPVGSSSDSCVCQVGGKLLPGPDGEIGTPDDVWVDDETPGEDPIVKPVVSVKLSAPSALHIGEQGILKIDVSNITVDSLSWRIEKDGVQVVGEYWGKITPATGNITFNEEGIYTVTAYDKNSTNDSAKSSVTIKVVPASTLSIEVPDSTRLEDSVEVKVDGDNLDRLSIVYSLIKDGKQVKLNDYVSGDIPGSILFSEEGTYTIVATGTDEIDTVLTSSDSIIVYAKPSMGFSIPSVFHTDSKVSVETDLHNMEDNVIWSILKDGKEVPFASVAVGNLSNNGGQITVATPGEYSLVAKNSDGVEYDSKSFTVYPIPTLEIDIPDKVRVGDNAGITVYSENYLDTDTIEWYLTTIKGSANWDDHVEGTLGAESGSIKFKSAGSYTLNAKITDITGRIHSFENLGTIKVIPVLSIDFDIAETAKVKDTVPVTLSGNFGSGIVNWSVKDSEGNPVKLSDIANGDLLGESTSLVFTKAGNYTFNVSVTDELGNAYSAEHSIEVIENIPSVDDVVIKVEDKIIDVNPKEDYSVEITVKKDGNPYTVSPEPEVGKKLNLVEPGEYDITVKVSDTEGNYKEETFHVSIVNNAPVIDEFIADVDYSDVIDEYTLNYKVKVNLTLNYSDPDGDEVTLVWADNSIKESQYLPVGKYISKVKAVDKWGKESEEAVVSFEVLGSKPVISLGSNKTVHIGKPIEIYVSGNKLEDCNVVFKLFKNGEEVLEGAKDITISGATLRLTETGSYKVTAVATDKTGKVSTAETSFAVTNTAPTNPRVDVDIDYNTIEGQYTDDFKVKVNVSATSTDADGDSLTYEYDTKSANSGMLGLGDYTVKVRAVDEWGLASEWVTKSFTVEGSAPNYVLTAPKTTVRGKDVEIKGVTVNGNNIKVNWSYSKDNGAYQALPNSFTTTGGTISFNELGVYTIRAEAIDATGAKSVVETSIECVNQAPSIPVINYSLDQTDLQNEYTKNYAAKLLVFLRSTDPDGDAITYEYDTSSAREGYYKVGTYTIKVRAVDEYGATSEWGETTVKVADIKSTINLAVPATASRNVNIPVKVSGTNIADARLAWSVTKNGINYTGSGLENIDSGSVQFAEPGSYSITVVATNIFGNTATDTATVEVKNSAPNAPIVGVKLDYTDTTGEFTDNFAVKVNSTVSATDPEGDTVTYEYDVASFNQEYATIGKHSIKVRAVDQYGAKSDWTSVTFEVKAEAPAFEISSVSSAHTGQEFEVSTNGSNLSSTTVKWVIKRGVSLVSPSTGELTNNGGTISFNTVGTYTITATATDPSGKSTESSCVIKVTNTNPTLDNVDAVVDYSNVQNPYTNEYKVNVDFICEGTDSDNDEVTFEFDNDYEKAGYHTLGSHVARVRAKDAFGGVSDWQTVTFEVEGKQPEMLISMPVSVGLDTDIPVEITTTNADTSKFSWVLLRDGVKVEGLAEDSIKSNGGILRFDTAGNYTLETTLTDICGKSRTVSTSISAINNAPTTPTIALSVNKDLVEGEYTSNYKVWVDVGLSSYDADGDELEFEIDETSTIKASGYMAPGTYRIRVRAIDSHGAMSNWATRNITVSVDSISLVLDYGARVHASEGVSVQATGTGIEDAKIDWSVTKPDGSVENFNNSTNVLPDLSDMQLGNYTVVCTVTGRTGQVVSDTAELEVYNNAPSNPVVEAVVDLEDCQNPYTTNFRAKIAVSVSANDPDGDEVSVEYAEDSEVTAEGYYPEGTYTVKVRATDAYGAHSEWVTEEVTIQGKQPEINLESSGSSHCGRNSSIFISGTNLDDCKLEWVVTKPDGTIDNDFSLPVKGGTVTGDIAGEWNYSVVAKNIYGYSSESSCAIEFTNNNPTISNPKIEIDYSDEINTFTEDYGVKVITSASYDDLDGDKVTLEIADDSIEYGESYQHDGGLVKFKVRAVDEFGGTSEWAEVSEYINFEYLSVEICSGLQPWIGLNKLLSCTLFVSNPDLVKATSDLRVSSTISSDHLFHDLHMDNTLSDLNLGSIRATEKGEVTLSADFIDKYGRVYNPSFTLSVVNDPPVLTLAEPQVYYVDTSNHKVENPYTSKAKPVVEMLVNGQDPDGDSIEYEFAPDSDVKSLVTNLPLGNHTVKVRARDEWGATSDWITRTFSITGQTPSLELTSPTLGDGTGTNGTKVDFVAIVSGLTRYGRVEYFDYYAEDKIVTKLDPVNFNFIAERNVEFSMDTKPGRHMLVARVVSITGDCAYASKFFTTGGDGQSSGSISISSNGTATYEDVGIYEGNTPLAYVKNYSLQVPDIPGHSGSDYLFVEGWNPTTNAWEQIARVSSNNAGMINSNGDYRANGANGHNDAYKLPEKKYTKVRMGYGMTNLHESCLQNASKFEYSVGYEFMESSLGNLSDLFEKV